MTGQINEVILEDFAAALHVEHDGVDVRFTMIAETDESEGVHVVVTRKQARQFARRVALLAQETERS